MKKTLITTALGFTLAASASAALSTGDLIEFTDLGSITNTSPVTDTSNKGSATAAWKDSSHVTISETTSEGTTGNKAYALSYRKDNNQYETMMSFTLDLEAILSDINTPNTTLTKTSIVDFHAYDGVAGADIGLLLNATGGLQLYYDSTNLNTSQSTASYTLFSQGEDGTWKLTDALKNTTTLTLALDITSNGITLWKEGSDSSLLTASLKSSSNHQLQRITLNSDYIDAVSIYPYHTGQEANRNELLDRVAPVPEPATATLSLLALAGLAARRRRK